MYAVVKVVVFDVFHCFVFLITFILTGQMMNSYRLLQKNPPKHKALADRSASDTYALKAVTSLEQIGTHLLEKAMLLDIEVSSCHLRFRHNLLLGAFGNQHLSDFPVSPAIG